MEPLRQGPFPELVRALRPTFRYLMETEVHVYAFSVAACVLLSLFPFLIVMMSFCHHVLKWDAAVDAVNFVLSDYFPGQLSLFIRRNLTSSVERGPFQLASLLLLLFVSNGIFEPLEVAFNRAWGVARHRSFLKNQLVSMGLVFACGTLALLSTMLTAMNFSLLGGSSRIVNVLGVPLFKMAAVPLSMLMLFLIYWLLPNRKIPAGKVAPAAVAVGVALEVLKNLILLTWPLLRVKLSREYGPFIYSASIVLWSFCGGMIVLAGAEWSARKSAEETAGEA